MPRITLSMKIWAQAFSGMHDSIPLGLERANGNGKKDVLLFGYDTMALGHLTPLNDGGPHISRKQGHSLSGSGYLGLVPLSNFPPT